MRITRTISKVAYKGIVKPICFRMDPEEVHNFFIKLGKRLQSLRILKKLVSFSFKYSNRKLSQNILGIRFENPVGLSAGFDKNAELISLMNDVGFGFVEVGSVTDKACSGNEGTRLWRIPEKKGLIVYLGLNNDGADEISSRLRKKKFNVPYGISIARTNCREAAKTSEGIKDYVSGFRKLRDVADYYTLNISCPNAYGGQPFSDGKRYSLLLNALDKIKILKPVFVKMSPDLTKKEIDLIINISRKHKFIKGFICSNLTKKINKRGKGGSSGKVVEKQSEDLLSYIYSKTRGEYILIGVGGIFSAEDAYRKIKLGANLVQLITGMIYEGPSVVGEINYGLARLIKRDGYGNISEAVGKGLKEKHI